MKEVIMHRRRIDEILQTSDDDEQKLALLLDYFHDNQQMISLSKRARTSLNLDHVTEQLMKGDLDTTLISVAVFGFILYCGLLTLGSTVLRSELNPSEKIKKFKAIITSDMDIVKEILSDNTLWDKIFF